MKNLYFRHFVVLAVLLLPISAFPYYFNNYQHLIGDRAAGMAGAYTALTDSSTSLWYNPAGLARLDRVNINISANAYSYLETGVEGYFTVPNSFGGYESLDVEESELTAIPTTLAMGIKVGDSSGFALGIFVPFQNEVTGDLQAMWDWSGNFIVKASYLLERKLYMTMLGFGTEILRDLTIGISAGLGYFRSKYKFDSRVKYDPGAAPGERIITKETDLELDLLLLQVAVGVQYTLWEYHRVGVHFRSPMYNLTVEGGYTFLRWDSNDAVYDRSVEDDIHYDTFEQLRPMSLAVGYAFTVAGTFSLSLDVETFFTTEYQENLAVNFKVGAEVFLTESLVLRCGFYTDYSQDDDITVFTDKGLKPFAEKLDYYGATFSLSYGITFGTEENRRTSWTTVGAHFRYGFGDIQCTYYYDALTELNVINDKRVYSISIFISETVSF